MSPLPDTTPVPLATHLGRGKLRDGGGRGDVGGVISALALAGKRIASRVRRARLDDVIGSAGATNLHGEQQDKLDVLADEILLASLRSCPEVAVYACEEREDPVVLRPASDGGRFCVVADPLDGSSNIDVGVSVGTIFSVLGNDRADADTARAVLQRGSRQLAAGYVLYGSSVALMLTLGDGVDFFVLDPELGEFVLVQGGLRIPERKAIYSINEAYWHDFTDEIRSYLEFAHDNGYASRYIGSMVADVHRTLIKGGVFIYPATRKAPDGKLRLLYECNPMAMLVEQAGGVAATGRERILDIEPQTLHQRSTVVMGSPYEVEQVTRRFA